MQYILREVKNEHQEIDAGADGRSRDRLRNAGYG